MISGLRSIRSRLTISIHCATGVRDMGWLLPQDVCAQVWIEGRADEDAQILARARTGISASGGSQPVWSGDAGSVLTFDISCGEGIDLSQLAARIEILCANTIMEDELIAVVSVDDLSQVVDSLPRDYPLCNSEGLEIGGALTLSIRDEPLETSTLWEPPLAAVLKILDPEKEDALFKDDDPGLPPLAKAVPLAAPTVAIPVGSLISQADISLYRGGSVSSYMNRRRSSRRQQHGFSTSLNDRNSSNSLFILPSLTSF